MDATLVLLVALVSLGLLAGTVDSACVPQDDCSGHYSCTAESQKLCLPNWTGTDCTVPVVIVVPEPHDPACPRGGYQGCKNEGTCFNGGCCCRPGFGGELCASDLNECDSNPCLNGGMCTDGEGNFECNCLPGTEGSLCATVTTEGPTTSPPVTTTTPPVTTTTPPMTTTTLPVTTTTLPGNSSSPPVTTPKDDFLYRLGNLEFRYIVMLGMGAMILVLFFTALIVLCAMPARRNNDKP